VAPPEQVPSAVPAEDPGGTQLCGVRSVAGRSARIAGAAMASVVFYFQVHQPYRLRRYSVFDSDPFYFDGEKNAQLCRKVADNCYRPATKILLDLIKRYDQEFSLWKENSQLTQFNKSQSLEPLKVSDWAIELTVESHKLYEGTLGAFDPSVKTLVNYALLLVNAITRSTELDSNIV
jgi:hypothetical protein